MTFNHMEMHMRRPIMLAFVFLGLATAFARPAAAQGFGVLGGVTFSDLTGDDVPENYERRNGFLAGVFAQIPLGSIITVQPEVQYVQKGAQGEILGNDFEQKMTYLDVPIFLSFGLPTSFGFHVMAGPNFSFELGCKFEAETLIGDGEGDCDDDEDFDERKSFISAAAVGAGINLGAIMIDGRFVIDLESFDDEEGEDFDVRNQVFELVAGIAFGGR
jgi:outer membrane immunogenic protein